MSKQIKITMNQKREAILKALKEAKEPQTLEDLSTIIGEEVKTGTTNAMVTAGLIKKVGTRKVAKTVYVEVATYALGDTKAN